MPVLSDLETVQEEIDRVENQSQKERLTNVLARQVR